MIIPTPIHRDPPVPRRSPWGVVAMGVLLAGAMVAPCPFVQAQGVEVGDQTPLPQEALQAGQHYYQGGQFQQAADQWEAALVAFARRGDWVGEVRAQTYLATVYQDLGRFQEAQGAIARSLEFLRQPSFPPHLQPVPEIQGVLLAQALLVQGQLWLAQGKPAQALEIWKEAEALYQGLGDGQGQLGSQLNQAQALQALGLYRRAALLLQQVVDRQRSQPPGPLKAESYRFLAIALQTLGDFPQAEELLQQSLAMAQELSLGQEQQASLLALGDLARQRQQWDVAMAYYRQVATATVPFNRLQAQLQTLRVWVQQGQWDAVHQALPPLQDELAQLSPSRSRIHAILHLAETVVQLDQRQPQGKRPPDRTPILNLLQQALVQTQAMGNREMEAALLLQISHFHHHQGKIDQAMGAAEQSLQTSQGAKTTIVTALAARQVGALARQQGQRQRAIAAYQEAVATLQTLRQEFITLHPTLQFSFQNSIEPIYRELVDLLLEDQPPPEVLVQVQDLMEQLQLAELENFFREACLDRQPIQLAALDPHAALIYPIALPGRLAVIISLPDGSHHYHAVPTPPEGLEPTLTKTLAHLSVIYGEAQRLPSLQRLYDWLLRPAIASLQAQDIKTLVFILDAGLRDIPMAVLHDGRHYLIETYNVALSPSLSLLQTQPSRWSGGKRTLLAAGISEARIGFEELPGVVQELQTLQQNPKAHLLLNQDFTRNHLAHQIQRRSIQTVHLATHGQFGATPEETFILAWDGPIYVREMRQFLQTQESTRSESLELLVLSACETALGDRQAVLGLAGMAVQSGARATLATLWAVQDISTAQLITTFYQQLQQPGTSKAQALRQAQLQLLRTTPYREPYYWAPFVLVGNWL